MRLILYASRINRVVNVKIKEKISFIVTLAPDSIGLFLFGFVAEIINRLLILFGLGNAAVSGILVVFFAALALLILCFRLVVYSYKKRQRDRM